MNRTVDFIDTKRNFEERFKEEANNSKIGLNVTKEAFNVSDITLHFIRENWAELSILFINELSSSYLSYGVSHKSGFWNNSTAATMVSSFFGAWFDESYGEEYPLSDPRNLQKIFLPGFIYKVAVVDHVFLLICLSKDNILYCDFNSETARGYKGQDVGPDAFRLDKLNSSQLKDLLNAYAEENFEAISYFHGGDVAYVDNIRESYKNHPFESKFTFDYLPITQNPTPALILDSCWTSLKMKSKNRDFTFAISEALDLPEDSKDRMVELYRWAADRMLMEVGAYDSRLIQRFDFFPGE